MVDEGYTFRTRQELGNGIGASLSFLLGLTDGYFYNDGSAVDCLVGLHFGLAKNYKIYRTMDISEAKHSDYSGATDEYKGYYLIIRG